MINYENGTIKYMSPLTEGTSQSGNYWARMDILLEVPIGHNAVKFIKLEVDTRNIDDVRRFTIGSKVKVGFNVSAREWKGMWYNNVDLVNIVADGQQPAAPAPAQVRQPQYQQPQQPAAPAPAQVRQPQYQQPQQPAAPQNWPQQAFDPAQNTDDLPFN